MSGDLLPVAVNLTHHFEEVMPMYKRNIDGFIVTPVAVESWPGSGFYDPSLHAESEDGTIVQWNTVCIQNMTHSSREHALSVATWLLFDLIRAVDCTGHVSR
jgi:hypothetical protein